MAQPSSSHRERERERSERSSSRHHHHRTISSTTLLLVLSLVLAVLAVMLSLPSNQAASTAAAAAASGENAKNEGFWGIITPKRTQALLARESNIAVREAEVARREAEILAGAPGGVVAQAPVCPPCATIVEKITEAPLPAHTVIKEVVKEADLTPPGWWDQARVRAEDILDRELKIAEREREISRREEAVNRREHDASRREGWIMEQLVMLNEAQPEVVEEDYIYNEPPPPPIVPPMGGGWRKPKAIPPPPFVITETAIEMATETRTVTHTLHETIKTAATNAPSNTRRVASPTPNIMSSSSTSYIPRTTSVEVVVEEEILEPEEVETTVTMMRGPGRKRHPTGKRWFGGW
ncbi:uncharacterized protein BXZ73DRAFT_95439 [Epithele typhae]|uniref:uncharacterized protein n=1 Tax=Epithele typhae TaxID=378194 RepID=UPI0020087119|nr:uncharacterized protein BXZ73DRAFT_95439 [Epithele typhae]KAH9945918.1 hypothetical protein BXZ73DRAFT_95439 [Epithele typhae]